ncbi:hypothetical protein VISI1226_05189 [Vibrio sinaloensis DSM 21326]|uniref:Uncharacterized protein n=1 Tax=Vibrio sinaloensis DSM 21326 TaxID=945550 RepID=E8M1J2_PHOS4|nr:DUF6653 family protein [Vibrio sinaloensis]EGA72172.1 hypothetical protein VISI1226_05189 [Vibrio sinaloensis DSM 21326]
MDVFKAAEKLMSMDESAWQRHSNPLSVYSRFTIMPLLTLVLVFRDDLGWWTLPMLVSIVIWTWLNPRLFSAPKNTNNWASMGTFGERIYLNRHNENLIPHHHLRMCKLIVGLQIIGLPIWCFAVYDMRYDLAVLSTLWVMFTKMWFVDRMVWLYQDVKNCKPEYQSWLKQ